MYLFLYFRKFIISIFLRTTLETSVLLCALMCLSSVNIIFICIICIICITHSQRIIIIKLYCHIQRALHDELECSLALTHVVPIYTMK